MPSSNSGSLFSGTKSLANLDLALYDSTDSFMGSLLDESLSTVDNVEHIYLTDLGPGTYTLQVSTESARDYGLAWRLNTLFDLPSADFNEDGLAGPAVGGRSVGLAQATAKKPVTRFEALSRSRISGEAR